MTQGGRERRRSEAGLSIVETFIVLLLIGVVSLLIVQAVATTNRANSYCRGQVRLSEAADTVARLIVDDVAASIRLFSDDAPSQAYRDALDTGPVPPLANARRPRFTNVGCMDPDVAGAEFTGNHLLLAQRCKPLTLLAPATVDSPELTVRIDLFRFVSYHPIERTGTTSHELDLARECSMPLAALHDLMGIADVAQRARICVALREFGIRHAWNPTLDRDSGLFRIGSDGGLVLLPPGQKVERDAGQSRDGLLGSRRLALAKNGSVPGAAVPLYAVASSEAGCPAFPGGFELRVDGPTSGRMVLVRLVLVATTAEGQQNWNEIRRIVACHDG